MDNETKQKQVDELEALSSIYGDEWKRNTVNSYSIQINKSVTLYITLNPLYPTSSPPTYELLAPCLSKGQKQQIAQAFEEVYLDNIGEPVLFQWVEKLRELVPSKEDKVNDAVEAIERVDDAEISDKASDRLSKEQEEIDKVIIVHGPTIVDRKSVFQAHVSQVSTEKDIRNMKQKLLENKKISQATHNISAYVVKQSNGVTLQDCDDDGETHAGARLLHLLQILGVENIVVVVSRWYGGIQLGPDRFRHINNAARQALQQSGHLKK